MKKQIALAFVLSVASTMAAFVDTSVNFGSANDGFGGFTPVTDNGIWAEQENSVVYTNNFGGRDNSGLLRDLSLSASAGNAYSFSSTFNVVELRDNAFNRVALSLFTTNNTVAGLDSGIHLMFIDNETIQISNGINSFDFTTSTNWNGAVFGPGLFTLDGTVSFVGTNAEIDLTVTDYNDYSQTLSFTNAASDFALGGYAGIGMRTRSPAADVFEVQDFSAAVVPEPATIGLFGVCGAALMFIRRRARRSMN